MPVTTTDPPDGRTPARPSFDPDASLLQLSPQDALSFRHLFEGTLILGATGSGKTSGPGAAWADSLLAHGAGFLILCAKGDESALWLKRAEQAGRSGDVRRFAVDQPYRLNLLDYAYRQPGAGRGGADPQNVVDLLMRLIEVKPNRGSAGDQAFWYDSARNLLTAAVSLLGAAGEPVSFPAIDAVIDSAPYSPEDLTDPKWQAGYLNRLLDRVANREPKLDAIQRNDARVALEYFASRFARMDDRTRGGVLSTVQSIVWPFRFGPAAELCGAETNLTPEDAFRGRIVLVDLPIKQFHESGLLIQACWKLLFMRAAEARDLGRYPLPVVLWVDEAQTFATTYDAIFQATSRSARVATVYLTQTLDGLRARYPGQTGEAETQALISNLGTKVLCANDNNTTNKWAADAIGQVWETRMNASATLTDEGSLSAGSGASDSRRYRIEPSTFLALRRGGPDRLVDAVLFRAGKPFRATGTNHLRLSFRQN